LCHDYGNDVFYCDVNFCNDLEHKCKLDEAYNFVVSAVLDASQFAQISNTTENYKPIPGWNQYCKQLYAIA
jgi:hypothetical protein